MAKYINPDYLHYKNSKVLSVMRELVFGMEDGMVSTLGSITGIAVGSGNHYVIILAGLVIIAVESISMGVGSYISSLSERDIDRRKISEEKEEIAKYPGQEKEELYGFYIKEGWPRDLARQMADTAAQNQNLMLQEMTMHELKVYAPASAHPLTNGLTMLLSYIVGGLVPLFAYFLLPIDLALKTSVPITLLGLFILGALTTRYSKGSWWRTGLRVLLLGGAALLAGYFIGTYVSSGLGR